jgi:predicted O-linked N-acetylglucosamine transferase (SPINDLY family)
MTAAEALALANDHFVAGRMADAESVCRALVAGCPEEHHAFKLLGVIAYMSHRPQEAVEWMGRAAELAPEIPDYHNNLSVMYAQLGEYEQAEKAACRALAVRPEFPEAESNLANALQGQGRSAEAEAAARRALALRPVFYEALNNLADALAAQDKNAEAEAAYREAIKVNRRNSTGCNNLGVLLQTQGRWEEAAEAYQAALSIDPRHADARANLGALLLLNDEPDEAEQQCRQALELLPYHYRAATTLGRALRALGRSDEALQAYRHALATGPDAADLQLELGDTLDALGRHAEAELAYRQALVLEPEKAPAHLALGANLLRQWRLAEAEAACRHGLQLAPQSAAAYMAVASVLLNAGRMDDASVVLRQGVQAVPDDPGLAEFLAQSLRDQGQIDASLAEYRRAVDLHPELPGLHSGYLHSMHYDPRATEADLLKAHAAWNEVHAAQFREEWEEWTNDRDPERPLRLGFVSADFNFHPVGCFLVSVLEQLTAHGWPTICYSDSTREDLMTARIRGAARVWRPVQSLSDERLADRIREDQVDVLIDLAGHGPRNRLGVFALKPAPVQVNWIGYRGTTGLEAIDFLVADANLVPAGSDLHYRERVLRLPETGLCFSPPLDAPDVGPLPAETRGYVTFGSFNNPAKINPAQVTLWAELLRRAAGSRLVLKYRGFDDPGVARRYREAFAAAGIDADRLELLGLSPRGQLLAAYQRIDIALDPVTHSGSLTTCEALWMGVPVVTCPGATYASRLGASHLHAAGLGELVAPDREAYVDLAARLADDRERLQILRRELRDRVARSPLCDARRFTEQLTTQLREVWREKNKRGLGA